MCTRSKAKHMFRGDDLTASPVQVLKRTSELPDMPPGLLFEMGSFQNNEELSHQ